jgi:hypothetical protein
MREEKIVLGIKCLDDLNKIKQLTSGILGEVCWKARLGYGDELKLEIGAKVHPKIRGTKRKEEWGAWMLGSRGTAWQLVAQDGTPIAWNVSQDDYAPDGTDQKLQCLVNTRITGFEALYPSLGLKVTFDNGHQLMILPSAKDDEFDLSYWELFTPETVIEVGPGAVWSYYEKVNA